MPPIAIGETLTFAVGERIRCHPNCVLGFGEGSKIDIVYECRASSKVQLHYKNPLGRYASLIHAVVSGRTLRQGLCIVDQGMQAADNTRYTPELPNRFE